MKITVTEFVTLDGVSQGPGSPTEDTTGGFTRGGWLVPYLDKAFVRRTSDWLDLADGLLLGREGEVDHQPSNPRIRRALSRRNIGRTWSRSGTSTSSPNTRSFERP